MMKKELKLQKQDMKKHKKIIYGKIDLMKIFNTIEHDKSKIILNPENNVIEVTEDKEISQNTIDNDFYERHKKYQVCYNKIGYLMTKHFDFESYLDIGCGCGFILEYFIDTGKDKTKLLGIESNESLKKHTVVSDNICYFPIQNISEAVQGDLVACMEVIEHIDEEHENIAVEKIANATKKYLWLTVAVPGQGSHPDEPHVNLKPLSYWEDSFEKYGLKVDWELTYKIKQEMLQHPDLSQSYFWFRDNLMIMRRVEDPVNYIYCAYCGAKKAYIYKENHPFKQMECKSCKRSWTIQI
jgi:SAM-dependent methyltransferase